MKVAPVSADLLIKLALGAVAVGLVVYGYRKVSAAAGSVGTSIAAVAEDAVNAINPASDQNLAYRGVNAIGSAVTGDNSFSLGSWLYDKFNADPLAASSTPLTAPQAHTAYWKS